MTLVLASTSYKRKQLLSKLLLLDCSRKVVFSETLMQLDVLNALGTAYLPSVRPYNDRR